MRLSFLISALMIAQGSPCAQNLTPKIIQADNLIKRWSTGSRDVGQQIAIMPPSPGVKVNEVYLDPAWKKSSIAIYGSDKLLDGFRVRYDLRANSIEFNINNEIKVLDVKKVKSMVWLDSMTYIPHNFVNGKEYLVNKIPMTSLIEVLTEGKTSLYKRYAYWIKKPDFNPALDVGSPDELIYKENLFYYGDEKALMPVPAKKKALQAVFGDKLAAIRAFMKERQLSLSREDDLVKIFDYFNSLQ